jgi:hypothetical protein
MNENHMHYNGHIGLNNNMKKINNNVTKIPNYYA